MTDDRDSKQHRRVEARSERSGRADEAGRGANSASQRDRQRRHRGKMAPTEKRRERQLPIAAFIPHRIEAAWNPRYAYLAGFPLSVMYATIGSAGGTPALRSCTYWFDPSTYVEASGRRTMWYVPRHESPCRVAVTIDTRTVRWTIAKYRGDECVGLSKGAKFDQAMLQTMTLAVRPDEPPDPD